MSSLVNPNEEEGTEEQLPELRRDAEDFMRSLNHDELVMEISELVHQQLVSSTLSGAGGFRNRLERLVMVSIVWLDLCDSPSPYQNLTTCLSVAVGMAFLC